MGRTALHVAAQAGSLACLKLREWNFDMHLVKYGPYYILYR